MFIQLVLGGQSLFDFDTDLDDSVEQCNKAKVQNITFSLAQDLVYNATGGKNWITPKHIGLVSTLHQTTRSKELVQLFHNAGHTISYENVLQVDNALAESTLKLQLFLPILFPIDSFTLPVTTLTSMTVALMEGTAFMQHKLQLGSVVQL